MKIFRSHDSIALVVLFIVVLSTVVMKNIVINNSNQKYNESHTEYTDIDIQTISIFR
jgi:hypothetical protein